MAQLIDSELQRRYEIPKISLEEVANHVNFQDTPEKATDIILAIAPCRSGTTAFLRVFGNHEIDSFYQPLKGIYRNLAFGRPAENFTIPSGSHPIYIKETLGPYSQGESEFNPLTILSKAGMPLSKVKSIVMMRNPVDTYLSWTKQFLIQGMSNDKLFDIFINSYVNTLNQFYQASELGITTIPYVYELQGANVPRVISTLFDNLGLTLKKDSLTNWDTENLGPHIHFADEPLVYDPQGLHDEVRNSKSLGHKGYPIDAVVEQLGKELVARILQSDAYTSYEKLRKKAERAFSV